VITHRSSMPFCRPGWLAFLLVTFALVFFQEAAVSAAPTEDVSYTFEIVSVPIQRSDDRIAIVDIVATLAYKSNSSSAEYPDIRPIVEDVRTFVRTYPEKKAYFEVIAKEAAAKALSMSPVVVAVTITLNIHTDETRSYKRVVRATITR
jgi:lysyl-tRNA synthetase class I